MSEANRSLTFTHSPLSSAVWTGLEPATPCVTGRYSNQLNYHTRNSFLSCEATFPLFCAAKLRTISNPCKYFAKKMQLFFEINLRAHLMSEITVGYQIKVFFFYISPGLICRPWSRSGDRRHGDTFHLDEPSGAADSGLNGYAWHSGIAVGYHCAGGVGVGEVAHI